MRWMQVMAGLVVAAWLAGAMAGDDRMSVARLGELLQPFGAQVQGREGIWVLQHEQFTVQLITDARADRMRILVAIARAEDLDEKTLIRLMQANFDTALDARYAIAQGLLWSTFIHPLSPLEKDQLYAGLAQTITLGKL